VYLAGFHKCLAEYTVYNLVTLLRLAYRTVLSNSVARWCNCVIQHAILHACVQEIFMLYHRNWRNLV